MNLNSLGDQILVIKEHFGNCSLIFSVSVRFSCGLYFLSPANFVTGHIFVVICECVEQRGSCGAQLVNLPACQSWLEPLLRASMWQKLEPSWLWRVQWWKEFIFCKACLYSQRFSYLGWLFGCALSASGFLFLRYFDKFLISRAYAFNVVLLKMSLSFVLHSCIFLCSLPLTFQC